MSRKNTQLAEVQQSTAQSYLDEMVKKYAPGTPITSSKGDLAGTTLEGDLYLEIPMQSSPVPQSVIDYANSLDPAVHIRDVAGHSYN